MAQFGLLGEHLCHSYSPQLHALLGTYAYGLYEVAPDNLADFLAQTEFDGLNVTIPYKKAVIPLCDELTDEARAIGSVNTLLRKNGRLLGDNTDAFGFAALLDETGLQVSGRKVLVLGSGGASRSVCYVLRARGAVPVVISRTGTDNYETLARHRDAAAIVNATPVGMYPETDAQPLQLDGFASCEAVIDLIYNPANTKLLLDAQRRGMRTAGGLRMLVAQASRASELFTGKAVSRERIEELTAILRGQMQNVILIGMPGCGKSTVGACLAKLTGREFLDCDTVSEQHTGRSVPDILCRDGETALRAIETQTLRLLCRQSGKVIATGGGVVTRPENRDILRQNGRIVFLERELAELDRTQRPLSVQYGTAALAEERLPLYRAWSDACVRVDGCEQTARSIRRELGI